MPNFKILFLQVQKWHQKIVKYGKQISKSHTAESRITKQCFTSGLGVSASHEDNKVLHEWKNAPSASRVVQCPIPWRIKPGIAVVPSLRAVGHRRRSWLKTIKKRKLAEDNIWLVKEKKYLKVVVWFLLAF